MFTYNKIYYNSIAMNIIDCFMYYDEDMILDIRLNMLDKYISHFIVFKKKRDSGVAHLIVFNLNCPNYAPTSKTSRKKKKNLTPRPSPRISKRLLHGERKPSLCKKLFLIYKNVKEKMSLKDRCININKLEQIS